MNMVEMFEVVQFTHPDSGLISGDTPLLFSLLTMVDLINCHLLSCLVKMFLLLDVYLGHLADVVM